jgi:2-keto-4-pentenoate hydratase/2-oxohepta-3-ene-1,7-dioic acid hydratase in catechol pathway
MARPILLMSGSAIHASADSDSGDRAPACRTIRFVHHRRNVHPGGALFMNGYKLVSYQAVDGARAGLLVDDAVHDVAAAVGCAAPVRIMDILTAWEAWKPQLAAAAPGGAGMPISAVTLLAPLGAPAQIYCAGANYRDHAAAMAKINNTPLGPDPKEAGLKAWFFMKGARALANPGATVVLPPAAKKMDWEAELAVVIGHTAKNVPMARAMDYVMGYAIGNDLSARDLGHRAGVPNTSPFAMDWLAHKNFDGSFPFGPWITLAEYVADPQDQAIQLWVNGELKQNSNASEMIFNIAEQISHLSEKLTLHPGDVVMTGTPAGTGNESQTFLHSGDVIRIRIGGLGELVTPVV